MFLASGDMTASMRPLQRQLLTRPLPFRFVSPQPRRRNQFRGGPTSSNLLRSQKGSHNVKAPPDLHLPTKVEELQVGVYL